MFLKSKNKLLEVLQKKSGSAVVLNQNTTDDSNKALPMSQVLSTLLTGQTPSFTMLVGFFGHREDGNQSEESAAQIIVNEAVSERISVDDDINGTAFRLAVGVNSSKAAQDASRAW